MRTAPPPLTSPDGMYFADEEVGGAHTPSRGTETCSVVEMMFSMRTAFEVRPLPVCSILYSMPFVFCTSKRRMAECKDGHARIIFTTGYQVTGNISYMDRLERVAFNALPAALWPDVTSNVYHHSPNQLAAPEGSQWGYNLYFCCSANVHQGWPKFVLSSVFLDSADGETIVIGGYVPSHSLLPNGVTVDVEGQYPFSDNATIVLSGAAKLKLRVPCWSNGANVSVDGGPAQHAPSCDFFSIATAAAASVQVVFENDIHLYTWQRNGSGYDGGQEINGFVYSRWLVLSVTAYACSCPFTALPQRRHRGASRGALVRAPTPLDRQVVAFPRVHQPQHLGARRADAVGREVELRHPALQPQVRGWRPSALSVAIRHRQRSRGQSRRQSQTRAWMDQRRWRSRCRTPPSQSAALHFTPGDHRAGSVRRDQHPHQRVPATV